MRRIISIFLSVVLASLCLAGCQNPNIGENSGKIRVVTTIFPEYDWTCALTEGTNNIETVMLNKGGVDLHSFQPTADDLISISSCDVLIYTGGESEGWITDALESAVNKDMKVINLLECIGTGAYEEETVEGMESEEEAETESDDVEYDEHVWLSVKNADIICSVISEVLASCDLSEADTIRKNYSDYSEELQTLDNEFKKVVEEGAADTLVFGDRFPFRYFVEDYKLNYYAAFPGCSAESEAGFETILFLGQKMDELGLKSILKIDGSDETICRTIIDNSMDSERQILTFNSMQSVSLEQAQNGMTYTGIMRENLENLKQALK